MNRWLAALCLLLVAFAARAADDPETVDIRVTHLPKDAGWRVRYRLEKPADRLRFVAEFGGRRSHWHVDTPGLHLVVREGTEQVERTDRRPFREVTLSFRSDSTK